MSELDRRGVLRALVLAPPALLLGGLRGAWAGVPLRINTHTAFWPLGPSPRSPGVFLGVVEAAAAMIGRRVAAEVLPAERSLRLVSAGVDDGDGPRIEQMDQMYPDLVRVPEPIVDYRFVAFAPPAERTVEGWSGLDGAHVAIVRGWKILERNLGGAASLQTIRTAGLLFDLLGRGRAEVAVFEESMGIGLLEEKGLSDRFAPLQPPLAVRPMYLFLHAEHRALAEPLAEALRGLKRSGQGRSIAQEVLGDRPMSDFPGVAAHWGPA